MSTMTIGQHESCDVRVDDPYASGRHAAVRRDPDGSVWVIDLGSTNGTRVERDGIKHRVEGPRGMRMLPGDVLWIGRTGIRWEGHATAGMGVESIAHAEPVRPSPVRVHFAGPMASISRGRCGQQCPDGAACPLVDDDPEAHR